MDAKYENFPTHEEQQRKIIHIQHIKLQQQLLVTSAPMFFQVKITNAYYSTNNTNCSLFKLICRT
jgi:hypothetical protein